ncbi:mitochondrial import inner membrane translocase subunit tim21 [Varicellaria rhodocarpa]|nr:mitochondrial import inner membrane translocase subunit tim21 [Varicellaria rhodocarpa]
MGEKLARTTQQTFNLGLILAGAVMTGGVGYLLYSDVFSSDSKTRIFNRTADRVKSDSRAIELLGPSKQILALGQERLGGSRTFGKRQAIQ